MSQSMSGADWFKQAIIYHIFIDRFAGFSSTENWDKPIFLGGNLKGIQNKLEYLKNLGVNTIWISPFNKTSAYHGYHVTDFYEIDPHFGTTEDLEDLIHSVHEQKMHIIADFVPNHCSREHPYFKEAQLDKKSPYYHWFFFTKWPHEYKCFLSIQEIPKLNLRNPITRNHIINAAKHWLSLGIDGYRLDHVIGPPHSFWKNFRKEIKNTYPQAVLIGEAWMMGIKRKELHTINIHHKYWKWFVNGAASDNLFKEYISELDGVLDFKLQELLRTYTLSQPPSKQWLISEITRHYNHFPKNYFLPTFLDNHDMDRFMLLCQNNKEKLKTAAKIQFNINQPAIIYYGTEIGMTQPKSIWEVTPYGDLQARQPMDWNHQDSELFRFYQHLISQKKN